MSGWKRNAMQNNRITEKDALHFHASGRVGKIEIAATKPLTTQRDLSPAYSHGVSYPCLRITEAPATAFDYPAKGNPVPVYANGTALPRPRHLGALAAHP